MISLMASLALTWAVAFEYREVPAQALFPGPPSLIEMTRTGGGGDPALSPFMKGSYLSMSGSKPYGIDALTAFRIRGGSVYQNFSADTEWTSFGTENYSENILSGAGAWKPAKNFSFSAGASLYMLSINDRGYSFSHSFSDADLSLYWAPFRSMSLLVYQKAISSLIDRQRRDLLFPETGAAAAYMPGKGLSLTLGVRETHFGPVKTAAFSAVLLKNLILRGGWSPDTSSGAFSFTVIHGNISADYGFRYHTFLGSTHSFGITAATEIIEAEPLVYNQRLPRKRKSDPVRKVDLNKAELSEIQGIPVMNPLYPERIVKYRELFGQVTVKSLYHVGMTGDELKKLYPYIATLPKEEKFQPGKKSRTGNKIPVKQRMKIMFNSLISVGLSPIEAMKVTEAAWSTDRTRLEKTLNELTSLTPEQKKKVRRICSSSR